MAKYSKALVNSSDHLVESKMSFLVYYIEKNNNFNPHKDYLISRNKKSDIDDTDL